MNAQKTAIEVIKEKLVDTQHGTAIMNRLAQIERLQRDLEGLGSPLEQNTTLQMPYSSMPNLLGSRCWK